MKYSIILALIALLQSVFMFNIDFQLFGKLLNDEKQVITSMKNYIQSKENKLKVLKEFVSSYEESVVKEKNFTFWENPIHTYFVIKRITIQWKQVLERLESGKALISNTFTEGLKNYTILQFEEAANSVARLAAMYDLDINLLSNGVIKYTSNSGEQKILDSNKTMDAFDCYNIGIGSYFNYDFSKAELWLKEALNRTNSFELKVKIFGFMSKVYYMLKEKSKAYDYLQQWLSLMGKKEEDMDYINTLRILLENKKVTDQYLHNLTLRDIPNFKQVEISLKMNRHLDELCQGKYKPPSTIGTDLKCFHLNTTRIPFLRLNLIRVEELHKRPQILFFHKLLTEYELQSLKNLTKTNETYILREYNRISENIFLYSNQSKVFASYFRRVEAITGLKLFPNYYAEVHKFYTGEKFWNHRDGYDIFEQVTKGDMASVITYWNDVEAGGATVFTDLNITVWPEKSSALVFFAYKQSGRYDNDLWHGGCPLLLGAKQFDLKLIDYGLQPNIACSTNKHDYFELKI